MDFHTIITGAIVIALCFSPFFYMAMRGKKREKKFFQSLLNKAKQLNFNVTDYEISGNIIIGLDDTNKELFFLKKINNEERLQHLNLKEIKSLRLNNANRIEGSGKNQQKVLDKLQLVFTYTKSGSPEVIFEFFNSDESLILNGELKLIEKWAKILKEELDVKPTFKNVA